VEADGEGLFRLACQHDLEGVVAKHKGSLYLPDRETMWFKIRNRSYSQWVGREGLFERERGGDPDFPGWDSCVAACAGRCVIAVAQVGNQRSSGILWRATNIIATATPSS
jgi:hypothetical protein